MQEFQHKVPKDANLKDFINLERYFNKKPAIFNKFYRTNLLQIVDLLPPLSQEQKNKYESQGQTNFIKKKKPLKAQEEENYYEEELLKNVTLGFRHQTDRLNQDLQINQYTFTGLLGRGAHSIVRLCKSNQTEAGTSLYACKILWFDKIRKKYFIKQNQLFSMVNNQITLLREMKNPNIISIKQAIYLKQKQRMFLILQHCSKGSINKLINNNLTIEDKDWWRMVKPYLRQFVQAIKYMHNRNILHRDIKPQNLLLNEKNELKVIDFNVSLKLEKDQKIKITNKFIGTKSYAAPQLILDPEKQKMCDGKKIDIWAMGITFLQILQRRHPYPVKTLQELAKVLENYKQNSVYKNIQKQSIEVKDKFQNHIGEKLQINTDYPLDLKDLLEKMLRFENQKRISIDQVFNHAWLLGINQ